MKQTHFTLKLTLVSVIIALTACNTQENTTEPTTTKATPTTAPGAPGNKSVWTHAGKQGIGTSYEQYLNKRFSDAAATGKVSKVWFSLGQGIITETMFGLIHQAQIKEMKFLIKGDQFLDIENQDTHSQIEYLHTDKTGRPLSLAYKVINRDKEDKYEIEKHVFTDPNENSLFVRVIFRAFDKNITPYLFINPHINNTGNSDSAIANINTLHATDAGVSLTLKSSQNFEKSSAGFVGVSDGLTDLQDNSNMDWHYQSTGTQTGNVAMTAQLMTLNNQEVTYDFSIGFGNTPQLSEQSANKTLNIGYSTVLAHYNGEGIHIGWEDYLQSLSSLESLSHETTDKGKLLYTSALVLKAQEDKTHAGALIASLSNPWGNTTSAEKSATGYKAVWPRDFYQCSTALLALGDTQTPLVAFEYLKKVQLTQNTANYTGNGGWFLQKTHVDGEIEWVGVQLDQTAMPIMLAWKLWKMNILTDEQVKHWYNNMLKPAADFLVNGGNVGIDWNKENITPPHTQQERWEEQAGYSPSTTATIIAGLVTAADLATIAGDTIQAKTYLSTADKYAKDIESTMFTTTGTLGKDNNIGNGKYFLRITENKNPNDNGSLIVRNGQEGLFEKDIIDAGFLELVRYGVRPANNSYIVDSLEELDNTQLTDDLRVKYDFTSPGSTIQYSGWRRYGKDGYGEDAITGANYGADNGKMSKDQRGRVWPFLTGERGHYEIALATEKSENISEQKIDHIRTHYITAMELFANEGLMLPEQVWDGVGNNINNYTTGEGTNSATPLAWAHAEYIKLLRSIKEKQVWDSYSVVKARYATTDLKQKAKP